MPRRNKTLAIDLTELATALEDHSGLGWYLDIETGDVLPVPDDADDDLLPIPREELVESDRFRFIEPLESRLGWEEMHDFAGRVGDRRIRELLEAALAGRGAFGHFKAVLVDHPEERARWYAKHDEHMAEQTRAWLDRAGIAWTARKVPRLDAGSTEAPEVQPQRQRGAPPGRAGRPRTAMCELCSGRDLDSHWIEVVPEGEGISRVTVDVTLRLCPEHRARLLQAVNREDSESVEPPRELRGWGPSE